MAKSSSGNYQVLARKYRPRIFDELIGQEAMVRILKHAFAEERVAQAYMLTGVRGVGKTTTARIIAKGLNCIGNGATKAVEPCGQCDSCLHIAEGRHMDVLELDAASRSQVNEMREILENVAFEPGEGRYRVYLIDEIHMLSTHAFNALLKTLEEPPEHVKFIFATTEIRKVPVTVLSRCQRFDLKRIDPKVMSEHLFSIANQEQIPVTQDAVDLIIRAAEGSVRDAVSLLDQVVGQGGAKIGAAAVRDMLGLVDRGRTLDLLELIMKGDASGALGEINAQFSAGADPIAILRDLAEAVHLISIMNVSPEVAQDAELSPSESERSLELGKKLPVSSLSRAWQMLLKALEEAANAPSPMMAVEMAVIRLCYVQDLPSAAELLKKLNLDRATPLRVSKESSPSSHSANSKSEPPRHHDAEVKSDNLSTEESKGASPAPTIHQTVKPHISDAFEMIETPPSIVSDPETPRATELKRNSVEGEQLGESHTASEPLQDKRLREAKEHELSKSAKEAFPNAEVQVVRSNK